LGRTEQRQKVSQQVGDLPLTDRYLQILRQPLMNLVHGLVLPEMPVADAHNQLPAKATLSQV
jgi:hypothetical protein